MSVITVQCHNCGAKYKLPETFEKPQAKCKACGATIDVAAQRSAASAPKATTQPQSPTRLDRREQKTGSGSRKAERPASGRTGRSAESGTTRGRTPRSEQRGAEADERPGRAGRAGRGIQAEAKNNNALVIGSIVGLLAIVAVVVVFMMSGGKEPADPQTAKQATPSANGESASPDATGNPPAGLPAAGNTPAGNAPAEGTPPPDKPAGTPASEQAAAPGKSQAEPAAAPKGEAAEKPAAPGVAATAEAGAKPAAAKETKKLTSRSEVYDPRKDEDLIPLPLADDVTEEEKSTMTDLLAAVEEGGLTGQRAKNSLQAMGHKALAPIINRLRDIDYLDTHQSMFAFELNKVLDSMLVGVNMGYKPMLPGEEVDLDIAHYNAQTARGWRRAAERWGTKEAFDQLVKTRRTRNLTEDR